MNRISRLLQVILPLSAVALVLALSLLASPLLARSSGVGAGPLQGTPTPGCGQGPWVTRSPLPYPAEGVSVAGDGTYIYANGGYDSATNTYHNETYRYDPLNDLWSPLAPAPDGHHEAPAVYVDTGQVYVLGGVIGSNVLTSTVRVYDIAQNTWSVRAPLPLPLSGMAAGYYNGKIYVAGGWDGTSIQSKTWSYDPSLDTWTPLTDMLLGVQLPGYGLINGQLYVAGGQSNGATNLVYSYDIAANTWHRWANLPLGTVAPGSAVVGNRLWLFGGYQPTAGPATYVYDPLRDQWSSGRPLTLARALLGGAAVGSTVFAVGGSNPSGDHSTVEAALAGTPCPPTGSPTPTRTPGGSPTPPPAAGVIAGGPGIQDSPDVDQDRVVWEDNSAGTWDIYARNLPAVQRFAIYAGPGDQRYPAISGDLVVWQDNRNGNWDIYGAYVNNTQPGPVFPIASGAGDQTHPAVSGDLVAWQSTNGTTTDIMVVDVTGGQPRTLSAPGTTNANPAIDGPNVVWQSIVPTNTVQAPAGVGRWDVEGYNVNSSSSFTVSDAPGDKTNPAIDGNLVVWQAYTAAGEGVGRWTVEGMDIGTSQPFTVTNGPGNQTEPAISDGFVVYVDSVPAGSVDAPLDCGGGGGGGTRQAVRGTGARSGGVDDSPISAYGCSASRPRTRGGRHVWEQDPPGVTAQADVYGNVCTIGFSDVHPADYFYGPVQALTCAGAISGYGDNTFRPYADTTRAQLAKIVVLGEVWAITTPPAGGYTFHDVPPANPFFQVIETAAAHGIISGYTCGGPGEPCDDHSRPYFRPGANVTRGQLSKIIVQAQGWAPDTSGGPHFSDVPPANPFYVFVETAYHRGIISGYGDGTFRVGANATRGQIAKIVWGALQQP